MTTPNNTVAGLAEKWRDIARRLGEIERPSIADLARAEAIAEQARLLREADNAEAASIRTVNRSPFVAGDGETDGRRSLERLKASRLAAPHADDLAAVEDLIDFLYRRLATAEQPGSAVQGEDDAREMLAAEYDRAGLSHTADDIRNDMLASDWPQYAIRAIASALAFSVQEGIGPGGTVDPSRSHSELPGMWVRADLIGGATDTHSEDNTTPAPVDANGLRDAAQALLREVQHADALGELPDQVQGETMFRLAQALSTPPVPAAEQGDGDCAKCGAPTDPDCGHVGECKPEARGVEGMVLVPREPTDAMFYAGCALLGSDAGSVETASRIYRAMLAAAPSGVRVDDAMVQWDSATRTMREHLYLMTGERDRYRMLYEQAQPKIERMQQRINELTDTWFEVEGALQLFLKAKAQIAADGYDGMDERIMGMLEKAGAAAFAALAVKEGA